MNNEPVGHVVQWVDGSLIHAWCTEAPPVGTPLYTHPSKDLTDEEYEKLMQQWDYWRKQIADGDKSSAPRDWFECVIENLLEQY